MSRAEVGSVPREVRAHLADGGQGRTDSRRCLGGPRRPAERRQVELAERARPARGGYRRCRAGTTRDVIEVPIDLAGMRVVIADTAGLREPGRVERGG